MFASLYTAPILTCLCLTLAAGEETKIGKAPLVVQVVNESPSGGAKSDSKQQKSQTSDFEKRVASTKELTAILKKIEDSAEARNRTEAYEELASLQLSPIPPEVSSQLLAGAMLDPDEGVRKQAAFAIRDLNDKTAKAALFNGMLNPKVTDDIRDKARSAVRWVDDPVMVEALVSIVTSILQVGTAEEVTPPQTIYITNGLDVNSPLGNINLPIELPNIELKSVCTVVAMYAVRGLRTIARRNLGEDPELWKAWFKNWKHIREVRLKQ